MQTFILSPITAKDFRDYGTVLDPGLAGPRLNFTADMSNPRDAARANLALIRAPHATLPWTLDRLERHPYSTQSFLPLGETSYLVIVALSGENGTPDLNTVAAFSVPSGVGIAYNPTTWHAGMSFLGGPGHFAMLIYESGTNDDCVYEAITPVQIVAPAHQLSLSKGI